MDAPIHDFCGTPSIDKIGTGDWMMCVPCGTTFSPSRQAEAAAAKSEDPELATSRRQMPVWTSPELQDGTKEPELVKFYHGASRLAVAH